MPRSRHTPEEARGRCRDGRRQAWGRQGGPDTRRGAGGPRGVRSQRREGPTGAGHPREPPQRPGSAQVPGLPDVAHGLCPALPDGCVPCTPTCCPRPPGTAPPAHVPCEAPRRPPIPCRTPRTLLRPPAPLGSLAALRTHVSQDDRPAPHIPRTPRWSSPGRSPSPGHAWPHVGMDQAPGAASSAGDARGYGGPQRPKKSREKRTCPDEGSCVIRRQLLK